MPNTNDKSGPDSTSEQPNVTTSAHQENKGADKPEDKIKTVKFKPRSGPNGTSEQP
jgi:hypothetical protein